MPGKFGYTPVNDPYGMDDGENQPQTPIPTPIDASGSYVPAESSNNNCTNCNEATPLPESSKSESETAEPSTNTNVNEDGVNQPLVTATDNKKVSLPTYVVVGSVVLMLLMVGLVYVSFLSNRHRKQISL